MFVKQLQVGSKKTSLHILAQAGDMNRLQSVLDRIAEGPRKVAFLHRFVFQLGTVGQHSIMTTIITKQHYLCLHVNSTN